MGNRDCGGEHRELQSIHAGDVAYRAVRYEALAMKGLQYRGMYFTDGGTAARMCVHVLNDRNARDGKDTDGFPPIRAIDLGRAHHRRIRGPYATRGGIPEDSRGAVGYTSHAGAAEALVAQTNTEAFDGIGNGARVETSDRIQSLGGQGRQRRRSLGVVSVK